MGAARRTRFGSAFSAQLTALPVRYIERFDPNFRPTLEAEDKNNYWYLDCAKRQVFAEKTIMVASLSHLEGMDSGHPRRRRESADPRG